VSTVLVLPRFLVTYSWLFGNPFEFCFIYFFSSNFLWRNSLLKNVWLLVVLFIEEWTHYSFYGRIICYFLYYVPLDSTTSDSTARCVVYIVVLKILIAFTLSLIWNVFVIDLKCYNYMRCVWLVAAHVTCWLVLLMPLIFFNASKGLVHYVNLYH